MKFTSYEINEIYFAVVDRRSLYVEDINQGLLSESDITPIDNLLAKLDAAMRVEHDS